MQIDEKELINHFSSVVRSTQFFKGWVKLGPKKFILERERFTTTIRMAKPKFALPDSLELALIITIYIPSEIEPVFKAFTGQKDGVLQFLLDAGGFETHLDGAYRSWRISDRADASQFDCEIETTVSNNLPAYLRQVDTPEKLLKFICDHERFCHSIPLVLDWQGIDRARADFWDYMATAPHSQGLDPILNWSVKYEILPERTAQQIWKACIQQVDVYHERLREILAEPRE